MRRSSVPMLLSVVAALLGALLLYALIRGNPSNSARTSIDGKIAAGSKVASPAQDFKLEPLKSGKVTSISQLRGKPVLLNFWGSWCLPCADEAPELQKLQERLEKSGTGTVLGVAYLDNPNRATKFIDEYRLSYPNTIDRGKEFSSHFGVSGAPETFAIDAQGRIVAVERQPISFERAKEMLIKAGAKL